MKRYFINKKGHRRKVTKSNLPDYLYAKDLQWTRIYNELGNRSGEHEIESIQIRIVQAENALEVDSDRWNNHRDEVYAEWIEAGWTKDEVDKDWEEQLKRLPKEITELKNELVTKEIDMNLKCRPERTSLVFLRRFGTPEQFREDLEDKVMKELNI